MLNCPYCGKPWKSTAAIRGHLKNHGKMRFQCRGCGSWYTIEPGDISFHAGYSEKRKVFEKYRRGGAD